MLVVFDTRTGTTMQLAEEIAEGAKGVVGTEVITRRVTTSAPETTSEQNERTRRAQTQFMAMREVSLEDLQQADGIVTGCPTRFGGMTAAMQSMWDATGSLWQKRVLQGKVGAVFTTTSTPHGGNEITLWHLMTPMMQHGMLIVAPGYGPAHSQIASSPYGATFVAGLDSNCDPDAATRAACMDLGRRVAMVAQQLAASHPMLETH